MRIYFDTSALVKAFVDETGSKEVKAFIAQIFSQKEVVFSTAVITKAEVVAALATLHRNRELSTPKYQKAINDFQERWKSFDVVEATSFVIDSSFEIGHTHKIKGCDAFQVASAFIDEVDLLASCDNDLNEAAKKNKLRVWNPMLEPIPQIPPEPNDLET